MFLLNGYDNKETTVSTKFKMRWSWPAAVAAVVLLVHVNAVEDLQDFDFEEPEMMVAMESRTQRSLVRPSKLPLSLGAGGVTNSHRPQYELDSYEQEQEMETERREALRAAVVRALERREHVGKFAQVLPIVRGMSGSQRGALAALVASQVQHRRGLTLHQVRSMYGSGPNATSELMLPILLDMANLFRRAARPSKLPRAAPALPQPQALRRSFTDEDNSLEDEEGVGVEEPPEETGTVTSTSTTTTTTTARSVAARGGVRARGRYSESRSRANKTRVAIQAIQAGPEDTTSDTPQRHNDTQSRDTQARVHTITTTAEAVTASPAVSTMSVVKSAAGGGVPSSDNVTLDQTAEANAASVTEDLPVAARLRGRFHERNSLTEGKPVRRPSWSPAALPGGRRGESGAGAGAASRRRPALAAVAAAAVAQSPGRKTPLQVLRPADHANCELFTNSLCLEARDYPTEAILSSLRRNKAATGALLAEYREQAESGGGAVDGVSPQQEAKYTAEHLRADRRGDSSGGLVAAAGEAGFMCPSTVKYARPQRARATSGNWKYIVNTGEHTQTLRLEKCLKPKESCTYLTDNFKSKCVQVYNYHRLLTWDQQNGLHMDIFKVPTCCSCHIEGYSVSFPPLGHRAHETSSEHFPGQDLSNEASGGAFESALPQPTVVRPSITKGAPFVERPDTFHSFAHSNSPAGAAQFSEEEVESLGPIDSYGNSYFPDSFKQASSSTVRQVRKPPRSRQPAPQYDTGATLPSYLEPPTPSAVSSADFYGTTPDKSKYATQHKRVKRPSRRPIRKTASGSGVSDDLIPSASAFIEKQSDVEMEEAEPQSDLEGIRSHVFSSTTEAATAAATRSVTQADRGTAAVVKDISPNKRVNYNYHPIIDFFESSPQGGGGGGGGASDRDDSSATLSSDSDWKPMSHPLARSR